MSHFNRLNIDKSLFLFCLKVSLQLSLKCCLLDGVEKGEAFIDVCNSEFVIILGVFEGNSFVILVHEAVEKKIFGFVAALTIKLDLGASIILPDDGPFVGILLLKKVLVILEVYF